MFLAEGGRPGDRRGFLHKKLLRIGTGLVKRFVPPVGIALDVARTGASFFGRPPARRIAPRTTTARPSLAGAQGKALGRDLKFAGTRSEGFIFGGGRPPASRAFGGIPPGASGTTSPCRSGESARCCQLRNGDFNDQRRWQFECQTAGTGVEQTPVGEAVMGRYGAALEPGVMTIERSVCLAGMQLGDDGLCYNKGAITNSQRQWPRGRRPLLTGGDMRAIGIAARAGSKLDRTTKRLRSLGMMKALPKGRGSRPHAHAKPIAAVSV